MEQTQVAQLPETAAEDLKRTEPTPTRNAAQLLRAVRARWRRWPYLRAVVVYLAARLISVAVLALMTKIYGAPLLDQLSAWDGQWYVKLAELGYDGIPDATDADNQPYPDAPYAFFPLFPAFMSMVSSIPGVSTVAAGLVISHASGIAAACGLFRLGQFIDPRPRVGLVLVALVASAPMSIVLSMTYTEAMFIALAVWALVGVLEKNWYLAGLCCAFAGLVRSTAVILIAVVVVAGVIDAWRGRQRRLAIASAAVAPLGLAGFWGAVAVHTDSWTGWQDIEWRGWATRFDFGQEAVTWVADRLLAEPMLMDVGTVAVVFGAILLAVITMAQRLPWPLVAYGVGVLLLVIGSSGLPFAKGRFLLPAMIVLLIPVAVGLANRRPKTVVAVLAGLTLASAWYGGYSLTAWQYAI